MVRLSLLLAALLLFTGCDEDLVFGPSIDSLVIDPDVVSVHGDGGMTDEHFTVTITVSGFEDEIDPADTVVFIQEPHLPAIAGVTSIEGNVITLGQIQKTWVGSLEPGEYFLGAEVHSATESALHQDLAMLTIEE